MSILNYNLPMESGPARECYSLGGSIPPLAITLTLSSS